MYSNGLAGLGDDPGFFDTGGMFESITKVVGTGIQQGVKIADQVKLYNQSKSNATAAQSLATSVAQAQQVAYALPVGSQQPAPSAMDSWTVPLLIGGVGLAALFIFKK